MRNYVHSEGQKTGSEPNGQHYYHDCYTHGPNQKHISQSESPRYLFRRSQEVQDIRITVSYVPINRREERRLKKSENNFRTGLIHDIQT
jgi:hypothetical protein